MSQFKYTLPSGKKFIVNGPAGATQVQADKIFYEQVAAGSLIGYIPGDTLTSAQIEFEKFGLSRLDRTTAGVSDDVVLAVVSGLPLVTTIPPLVNVPIENPITQEEIAVVSDGLGPLPVGPLTPNEVQALEAQKINITDQPYYVITREKGIGKYGFNCIQLEKAGYVKPSTSQIYLGVTREDQPNPENFIAVMRTPSIWTGKNGVTSLDDILFNEQLQNQIYNELMLIGYQALVANGTIVERNTEAAEITTGVEYTNVSPYAKTSDAVSNQIVSDQGALVNLSATYGPEATAAWSNGSAVANPAAMDTLGKSSLSAVGYALALIGTLFGGIKAALGYADTVNRDTVDAATTRIIGNAKIQAPEFSPSSIANQLDLTQAQQLINSAKNQGQTAYDQLAEQSGRSQSSAQDLINRFRA